jgi:hypothetical protein
MGFFISYISEHFTREQGAQRGEIRVYRKDQSRITGSPPPSFIVVGLFHRFL